MEPVTPETLTEFLTRLGERYPDQATLSTGWKRVTSARQPSPNPGYRLYDRSQSPTAESVGNDHEPVGRSVSA